jgi:hypothetical protein
MERLYREYKNEIEFLIVYIREAHPEMLRKGNKTGVVGRPKDIDERLILATECVTRYKFSIPMVIDAIEGGVNSDYQAAPVRVTITDKDGKVAYYAGRGPFDFRLSKVESVLKKIVAHEGFLPPPPPAAWGKTVDGLRLGLSLDPANPMPGEPVTVILSFRNMGKKPLYFYYRAADPFENLELKDKRGRTLKLEAAGGNDRMAAMMSRGRGGFRIMPQKIDGGASFKIDIEAKLVPVDDPAELAKGSFQARYSLEVTSEMVEPVRRYRDWPYWTGKVVSGAFDFVVKPPKVQTCMSCHGVEDRHHVEENDCARCHIGEEGTEDFTTRKDACSSCHPREGIQGRRLIPETTGSYAVHIAGKTAAGKTAAGKTAAGKTANDACLRCHDHGEHQKGNIRLIDPCSMRKRLWTGSETEFCLRCHDGDLPAGLSFPPSKDNRYVKTAFLDSPVFLEGKGCTDCHTSHGSSIPPLLRKEGIVSPHE